MEIEGKTICIIDSNLKSTKINNKEIYILDTLPKKTKKEKVLEALKMVNLTEDYILKKSNDLSNSEYSKLLLARDLASGSKIIFLDYFYLQIWLYQIRLSYMLGYLILHI